MLFLQSSWAPILKVHDPPSLEFWKTVIIFRLRKGVGRMDKMIRCKDLGSECGYTACAKTEVGLFKEVLEHSHAIHGMKEFSKEFYDKVQASMQEGYCDLEEELCNYSDCCNISAK